MSEGCPSLSIRMLHHPHLLYDTASQCISANCRHEHCRRRAVGVPSATRQQDKKDQKQLHVDRRARCRHGMSQHDASFDLFAERLAPLADTIVLGKNISGNQPDVEVLAMTLKDIPLDAERFNDMSAGKGWVSAAFSVLMVGGPGFSSVPYTANKKKGERESESKSVYEVELF